MDQQQQQQQQQQGPPPPQQQQPQQAPPPQQQGPPQGGQGGQGPPQQGPPQQRPPGPPPGPPPPPPECKPGFDMIMVTIHYKPNQKFGMMVKTSRGNVMVSSVQPGSICHGVVKELDQIFTVNGQSVNDRDVTKDLIVASLKEAKFVDLLIHRPMTPVAVEQAEQLMNGSLMPSVALKSDVRDIQKRFDNRLKANPVAKGILMAPGQQTAANVRIQQNFKPKLIPADMSCRIPQLQKVPAKQPQPPPQMAPFRPGQGQLGGGPRGPQGGPPQGPPQGGPPPQQQGPPQGAPSQGPPQGAAPPPQQQGAPQGGAPPPSQQTPTGGQGSGEKKDEKPEEKKEEKREEKVEEKKEEKPEEKKEENNEERKEEKKEEKKEEEKKAAEAPPVDAATGATPAPPPSAPAPAPAEEQKSQPLSAPKSGPQKSAEKSAEEKVVPGAPVVPKVVKMPPKFGIKTGPTLQKSSENVTSAPLSGPKNGGKSGPVIAKGALMKKPGALTMQKSCEKSNDGPTKKTGKGDRSVDEGAAPVKKPATKKKARKRVKKGDRTVSVDASCDEEEQQAARKKK